MRVRTDTVWLNGALVERTSAQIDPLSHGLIYGAGVYDSLLLRDGVPVALQRHLSRLANGAARLGLSAPPEEIVQVAIRELASALDLNNGRVRITLGAGPSQNVQPCAPEENITLITLIPLTPPKASASITITPFRRNRHSPLAGIKHTACAENLLAQRAALAAGFDEAVFLNTSGELCEGAFSNIFIVRENRVVTPPLSAGCLPGVTREVVLELFREQGISCIERVISAAEVPDADEIFLTSSIRGVQSVHRLDTGTFSTPGPFTQRIGDLYAAWLDRQE